MTAAPTDHERAAYYAETGNLREAVEDVLDVEGEEIEPAHTTELVVADVRASALMRPVADEHDIVEAFKAYQLLREALLEPSDFQEAERGKHFVKKSGWRKLAVAMGVSDEIVARDYDRDDRGRITRAEVTVRAVAPNGRYVDALGICDYRERCCPAAFDEECTNKRSSHHHCAPGCSGFSHFSKPQHDIPSTAHTRAKNRALSDLFGFGEVSAEEITAGVGERAVPDEPADGDEVAAITAALNAIGDTAQRRGTKLAFANKFGRPHELMKSQVEAARRFVTAAGGTFTDPAAAEGASPTDASAGSPAESSGSGPAEGGGHVGAPSGSTESPPPGESSAPDSTPDAEGSDRQPSAPPPSTRTAEPAAATTPKPSTAAQRGRIGMKVKELETKQLLREGDKAELVAILSGERTTTSTEFTYDEATHMVSLLAFIEAGDLSVEDAENGGRQVACLTQRGKDFLAPIVEALA